MPYPINTVHRLLLEDGVSFLLLEDNASKIILDETVALDDPLNAGTVNSLTPGLTFAGQAYSIINRQATPTLSNPNSATTPRTIAYQNNAGFNQVLVVKVMFTGDGAGNGGVTSITYGGISLTSVGAQKSATWGGAQLWILKSPPNGNNYLIVTMAANANKFIVTAETLENVDQTTTFRTAATSNSASATSVSDTISGVQPTDWLTDVLDIDNTSHAATVTGVAQTLDYAVETAATDTTGATSTNANPASGAMSWSWTTAKPYSHVAVAFIPVTKGLTYEVEVDTVNTFDSQLPISRITAQDASGTGSTSVTATYPSTPTSGNLLVAVVANDNGSMAITGWTRVFVSGLTRLSSIFYKVAGASEPQAITVTDAGASLMGIAIYEYRGFGGAPSLDKSAVALTVGSANPSGTTATTVAANELLIAVTSLTGVTTISSVTNSFTIQANIAGFVGSADLVVSATGTYTTTFNTSASEGTLGGVGIATFKTGSSGTGPLLDKTSDLNTGFIDDTTTALGDDRLLLETSNGGGSLLLEDNSSKLAINYGYPSTDYVTYNVPSATLSNGVTYYWRVRRDPSGSLGYGDWSEIRSFLVSTSTDLSISVTDTATITETATPLVANLVVNVSDTATITETTTRLVTSFISVTDSPTITESTTFLETSFISVTDSPTITESTTRLLTSFINVTDSSTITETVTPLIPTLLISVTDSATITESTTLLETSFISVTDSPTITESTTLLETSFINVSDSPTITETITLLETSFISVTDSPTITETVTMLVTSFINKTESITVTETPTVTIAVASDLSVSVSDTANITESTTLLETSFINTTDSINIVESQSFLVTGFISATDSPTITETTALLLQSFISVSDPITITESQTVYEPFYLISVTDTPTITETQTLLETSFISVSDLATITETTTRLITSFVNVSDSPAITESTTLLETSFVNVSDSPTITESTTRLVTSFISVSDTATITETTTLLIPTLLINVSDTATITETFNVFIQVQGAISVSDTPTITETVTLLIPTLFVSVTDSTSITETATLNESVSVNVTDTATITETTTRLITELFLSVSDNIVVTEATSQFLTSFINVSDSASITESTTLAITGGTYSINVSDSVTVSEFKSVFIEGTTVTRTPSIIFLTDGHVAVKLGGNLFMPL